MKKIWRILKRIVLVFSGILLLLMLLVYLFLKVPSIQNRVADKAAQIASKSLNTKVQLGEIQIVPPNMLRINDFYVEGNSGDSLFSAKEITANISLVKLLCKKIEINHFSLNSANVRILKRTSDSTYNFEFGSGSPSAPAQKTDTTEGSSWAFDIDEVELNNVDFSFADKVLKNNYKTSVGFINITLDSFNLVQRAVHLGAIDFSDSDIFIDYQNVSGSDSVSEDADFRITVSEDISFRNINFHFNNFPSSQLVEVNHLNLEILPKKIDLPNNLLALEEITLRNSEIAITNFAPPDKGNTEQQAQAISSLPWTIDVSLIKLENNTFRYSATKPPSVGHRNFDPENMDLSKLSAEISNVYFDGERATADFKQLSFSEHDSFILESFTGGFKMNRNAVQATDVLLQTAKSKVQFSLSTGEIDLSGLPQNYSQIPFQLNLRHARVHHEDIAYFYQDSAVSAYGDVLDKMVWQLQAHGPVNDLQIQRFRTQLGDQLTASVSGEIAGLPNIKAVSGKLIVDSLLVRGNEVRKFLPDSLFPENLRIPEKLFLKAKISGDYLASLGNVSVKTSAGNLSAKMHFQQDTLKKSEEFDLIIKTKGLDMGALYPMGDTLGIVIAEAKIKGHTKAFKNPAFEAEAQVDTLQLMGYPYAGLNFQGTYESGVFSGNASIADKNIKFTLDGTVDLTDSVPDLNLIFEMPGADLQALNLTEQDIRVGLNLSSDLHGNSPDNSNGHLSVKDVVLVKENQRYELDSVVFRVMNDKQETHLSATSELFNLDFSGNIKFSDISSSLLNHLNLFFKMDTVPLVRPDIPKHFNLSITLNDHPLITELFFPELTTFGGCYLEMAFDQNNSKLIVDSKVAPMAYGGFELDSTRLHISSEGKKLVAQLRSSGIERSPIFIPVLHFETYVENNDASWSFDIEDINGRKKYAFSGTVSSENSAYRNVLNTDSLFLNYSQWDISENNAILLYNDSLVVHDFILTNGPETLTFKQVNKAQNTLTKIVFDAFRLKTLTNIATSKDLTDAKVDGYFAINWTDALLSSELTMHDFLVKGQPLFKNIHIGFDQSSDQITTLAAEFNQQKGKVRIQGRMNSDQERSVKAEVSFDQFTLDNLQPFFEADIKSLSGQLDGKIAVANPSGKLELDGNIAFSNTKIVPKLLGTSFKIDKSELRLDNNTITLNQFTITDAKDQKATLDGEISGILSSPLSIDLNFASNNYTFLNAKEGDNELFYGNLTGDVSAAIRGNMDKAQVQLSTTIRAPSDFYFIVPTTEYAAVEREGLVVFVKDEDENYDEILEVVEDTTGLTFAPGLDLDLTARISVEKEARLTIIVDPSSDEQLSVKGTANLNYNMTGGSQQSLTGQYLISSGKYTLTLYDVVKREFDILENSSITWTGDVMEAQADLSATYQVRTSAEGLISNEISNLSEDKRRQLSQPYPFLVTLHISGVLLQPNLNFDISLPQNVSVPEITNKLEQINQNESEVNKQAFALLVLGNFIQNNMSSSRPISYELNSTARSSISKILSTQLNRLAEKYIKGVDVNVRVNSYADYNETESQKTTNVKLDVRKRFFNDRLSVQLGGKVNIEGEQQSTNSMQRVAGDVVVLYDLTEDGRFKIKGFNTTEYENMFEGELRKTGVGIIYNRDYYHFRNLFQSDSIDVMRERGNKDNLIDEKR